LSSYLRTSIRAHGQPPKCPDKVTGSFLFDCALSVPFKSGVPTRSRTPLIIFILAGGRSSRMGRDKSRLLLGGKTFLQRITSVARELDAPVELITEDERPGSGPLGGIATAFKRFSFERALFLSCDTPLITPEFLRRIAGKSQGFPTDENGGLGSPSPSRAKGEGDRCSFGLKGAVFTISHGRAGFPFILPRAAGRTVLESLRTGRNSIQDLRHALNAELITPSEKERAQLFNVNTPADYELLRRSWAEERRSDAVLEVRNLSIHRGNTRILADFSWRVRQGEHWVVLGANGCGKTSLFSALLGYVTPTRGDIFVLNEEYGDCDWPALRKKIGMVSSTVRQMMAESEPAWITVASGKYAIIDFWGTPKKRDRDESLALLRQIECEYLADRPWAVLSQGERQRVLIARALIAKPALLILDEPCAGLDPAAREHFLHFLEHLGRTRGCPAIVLVTHHVEEVMPVFTHALLMKHGRKLAEGTVSSLLNSARLTETFDTPIQVRKSAGRYALNVTALRRVIA
jgi:iron complex transport system ATP-binding protein